MVAPFDQVFDSLRHELERLEATRVTLHAKYKAGMRMLVAALLAAVAGAVPLGLGGAFVPAIAVGVVGVAAAIVTFLWKVGPPQNEYRGLFKGAFIQPLVASAGEDVHYFPDQSISLEEYGQSGIYSTGVDRWHGEDLITGRVGETDVRMSELHTEYKTESTDKDGNTSTSWHTIFRGLFISADFHKHFHGVTYVRTDVAESTFGAIGRIFQRPVFSSLELVQLEDVEFERAFTVTSSDQVEARYILSTSMMRRMLALKERFQSGVQFAFVGSRMYIAIPVSRNLFEPSIGQSVLDGDYLRSYHQQVADCIGVVEAVGLNVRVWTKE